MTQYNAGQPTYPQLTPIVWVSLSLQYVSTPGLGRMPPGSDVVYSVISGGVTLAKQVSDLVFAQQAHRLAPNPNFSMGNPPGGAEEKKDMETGADGRPLWRKDHGPSTTLHVLRELGMEGISGPGDRHRPSGWRRQLCRPARVRSD